MLEDTIIHPNILIFYLLDLFLPKGDVERPSSIDSLLRFFFLAAYLRNLLEQDSILSLYLCVFGLKEIVFLRVLVQKIFVRLNECLAVSLLWLLQLQLKKALLMVVHSICDFMLLYSVLERDRWELL